MLIRRLLLGPLVLLIAWMTIAFFVVRSESTAKKKVQLTLGSIGEPDNLNPILSQSRSASEVEAFLFNALLSVDENYNIEGDVAEKYSMRQTSTGFFTSPADAQKAYKQLQAARDFWPAMKLTSVRTDGNRLVLEMSGGDNEIVAGTGYEEQLFKIIDANQLFGVSVLTISHDTSAKLANGSDATTDSVKARLEALAGSLENVRVHEAFAINDSLLSVTVIGDAIAFRQALPGALTGLKEGDEELKPVGEVIEYLDQAMLNEPVLEFKLRTDVRWHDGEPLTSIDAEFMYRSLVDPNYRSPRAGSYWLVKDVEAPDPTTFIVTYRLPYVDCLYDWMAPIIPSHILKGKDAQWWADNYNSKPIGSGPFKIVEWKHNEYVRLEADPNYHEGPPSLPAVVFRVVPDPFVIEMAFQEDGFDTAQLLYHQVKRYEAAGDKFKLFRRWSRGYLYIGWNLKKPLFADKKVRRALAHAINIDQIIEYVYNGWARPSTGPVPRVYWYANPNIKRIPYDIEKAKRMLTEAGWTDSDGDGWLDKDGKTFEFSLITNQGNVMRALIQTLVQDDLKKVGIKVNTGIYEWAVFLNNYIHVQQFDACVLGWLSPITYDKQALWHSSQSDPPGLNFCSYENPEADRLIEKIRVTFEKDKLEKMLHRFEEIVYEDQPYLFLLEGMPTFALYNNRYVVHRPEKDGNWITEEVRNTEAGSKGYDFYMPWWAPKDMHPTLTP